MPTEPSNTPTPAPGIPVRLPDGSEIIVPHATIRQALRALALHPTDKEAETHRDYLFRLRKELDILLGPALDGLAGTLPPVFVRDLTARLWRNAVGLEPFEPAYFPLRETPAGPSKSTDHLLAIVNLLRATVREKLSLSAQQVDDMLVWDAFQLHKAA